jgi:ferrochelatase
VAPRHDAVLLIAFGGPTRPEEVRPFLDNVLRGRPVPRARHEEVVRHYAEVGGSSPLNRLTFRQAEGLRDLLAREGPDLPVYVGMRHWAPYIAEALAAMSGAGRRRAVGLVLAPHPSRVSLDAYLQAVAEARERLGPEGPAVDYVAPWFDHPLFIEAVTERIADALSKAPPDRRSGAAVVFTAHSLPVEMARGSNYEEHVRRTAELASGRLGIGPWSVAYQSRSGGPAEPWTGPDIEETLRDLGRRGARDVVVAPIGFVSENMEILYDLDVAARAVAGELGIGFFRAATVDDHPSFLRMMAVLVRDVVSRAA